MTIERHSNFDAIGDDWEALAGRVAAPPFLRPGWFRAWWTAFGHGSLEIVALRRDGRLAAVLPLCRRLGVLRSLTNWHQPEFGIVAEDAEARTELAIEVVARARSTIVIGLLDGDGPDCRALRAAARIGRARLYARVQQRSPYLDIAGDWESFLRGIDGSARADMRRRRRRLAERGDVTTRIEDRWERLDPPLTDVFALEGSGWKAEAGTAIASDPATAAFYTEIAHWAAERGWLRLGFLDFDGHPVAAELMLVHAGVMYGLKGGYDTGFRAYGPGRLLRADVLEHCFERGLRRLDFLGEESRSKRIWTDTARDLTALELFPRSTAGAFGAASYRYGRPMAKRTRAVVSRLRH